MKLVKNINDFIGGWIIGDFEPSLLKTKHCEVGIKKFYSGYVNPPHYHKKFSEMNIVIDGKCQFTIIDKENHSKIITEIECNGGNIFIIDPLEIVKFCAIEPTTLCVFRNGSDPNDKIII